MREFPLEPEEMEDWAVMIKKAIPDVNPIMIEEAIVDLASGKREYNRADGVKSVITAIQLNKGENWYWDPNK